MKDVRRRFSRRGVSEGLLGYRELLDDVLQQGRVGQQVAAERRVLQHHGQDLAQLRQLLLTQVPDPQRLQDTPAPHKPSSCSAPPRDRERGTERERESEERIRTARAIQIFRLLSRRLDGRRDTGVQVFFDCIYTALFLLLAIQSTLQYGLTFTDSDTHLQ